MYFDDYASRPIGAWDNVVFLGLHVVWNLKGFASSVMLMVPVGDSCIVRNVVMSLFRYPISGGSGRSYISKIIFS